MRGMIRGMLVVSALLGLAVSGPADEVPDAFLPFESLIGGWKGNATPSVNRVKGWSEKHGWAWKFEEGKPTGLSLTFEGDKTLAKGLLTFDPASGKYRLDGTDPGGKAVRFLGTLNPAGPTLTLDREGPSTEGRERLILFPNSNKIRYTLKLDRQEPGAPQFKTVITVGLTKDGESFAAGGAGGGNLPRCILTGGAAGLTVSYLGKTYPVCCTGCRDEFNDNPEKYVKKAEQAAQAEAAKGTSPEKPAVGAKDDGSFDGLVEGPKTSPGTAASKPAAEAKPAASPMPSADSKKAKPKDTPEVRAGRELQLGQNFEKQGKNAIALGHYRKVVKDYPGTDAAKTAATRIKAIEPK